MWIQTCLLSLSMLMTAGRLCACGLEFVVLDENNRALPYKLASFQTRNHEFVAQFSGLRGEQLPCDRFDFVVERADFKDARTRIAGTVNVREEHQWITLHADPTTIYTAQGAFSNDRQTPKNFVLRGKIEGFHSSETPTWVRVSEVFGGTQLEVAISADGSFTVSQPVFGICQISVLQPGRILASTYFTIRLSNELQMVRLTLAEIIPANPGGNLPRQNGRPLE